MELLAPGARIRLAQHFGTIRYVGEVDGTSGTWLGIEWDDPSRGRHDGLKDNRRYFTCRNATAGSFIRPSANLSYGRSFLEALASKYIEAFHGEESAETVVLGSSQGAIIVEAVRLDKIRGKLANLALLREASLDNEDVAKADAPGAIQNSCPSIQGLDLSLSLIPSWDIVALISKELPKLRRLVLNRNRLASPTDPTIMRTAFLNVTELLLNGTAMTWSEMQAMTVLMPTLRIIEMGYNSLTHLQYQEPVEYPDNNTVHTINLDSNFCYDWVDIWKSLRQYKSLQWLILTSNRIKTIPFPKSPDQSLTFLKHVALSHNKIESWSDIDALSAWCPTLETLTSNGNLLMNQEPPRHVRPFIISRIPSLLTLDGATISPRERIDSEIFYQSNIVQHGPKSEEERRQAHPQWDRLCTRHGIPEGNVQESSVDKLSKRLISLNLHDSHIATEEKSQVQSVPLVLKVLPSMTLRTFRMKLFKVLKCGRVPISLSICESDGGFRELHEEQNFLDLGHLGLEDGTDIIYGVKKT